MPLTASLRNTNADKKMTHCQQVIPLDSREAKEMINTVHYQTWDTAEEFDRNFDISKIYKVYNQLLEREFQAKRTELRDDGRSAKELSEHYAFKAECYSSRVKEHCMKGLYCNENNHILGDGTMGVSVWRCPDLCLKSLPWPDLSTVFLVLFRIIKGRVKPVTAKQGNQETNLEPTPNYDCHVSKNVQHSSVTDVASLMAKTQYYLYEYNEEGLPRDRPRHCLPFAVIHLNKAVPAQPDAKKPVREALMLNNLTNSEVLPDTISKKAKIPYLTENDGKMAWRGLIGSKESSLGVAAIMAGHKLGLTLWKSFIDVRKKLPLDSLRKVIPGDIRTAWNKPLRYRSHTFSLCVLKPCSPADKFINFIKSLSIKEHAAGVVDVDSSTIMFLVPSSKLSVELGFCEDKQPWRMFCIIRRRHRLPVPNRASKSPCLNPEALQPNLIEPQGLNINLKLEAPNVMQEARGVQEHTGIRPYRRMGGISRSKSADFTNITPKNTLMRTISDTVCCNVSQTGRSFDDINRLAYRQQPPVSKQQQPALQIPSLVPSLPSNLPRQPLLSPPPPQQPKLPLTPLLQLPGTPMTTSQLQKQPQLIQSPSSPQQQQQLHETRLPLLTQVPLKQQQLQQQYQPQLLSTHVPLQQQQQQQQQQRLMETQVSSPQQQQQQQQLQTQPLQHDLIKSSDDDTQVKQPSFSWSYNYYKKVGFQRDRIPFLEDVPSSSVQDENISTTKDKNAYEDKEYDRRVVAGGIQNDDQDNPTSNSKLIDKDGDIMRTKQDTLNDNKYHKHLQTLVPCTNPNKNTVLNIAEELANNTRDPRIHDSHSTACSLPDTEQPTCQDKQNDDKSDHAILSSNDLSPRSFGVYIRHKESLKRKLSLTENERDLKKRRLDFGNGSDSADVPNPDSSIALNIQKEMTPTATVTCRDVSESVGDEQIVDNKHELQWTSGLQVIELLLIEQDFQEIDEKIECLEKENAFEILDIDSVTEVTGYEARMMTELPDNNPSLLVSKNTVINPGCEESQNLTSISQDLSSTSLDLPDTCQDTTSTSQDHHTSTSQDHLTNTDQDLNNISTRTDISKNLTNTSVRANTSQGPTSNSPVLCSASEELPIASQNLAITSQDPTGADQDLTITCENFPSTSQDPTSTGQDLSSTSQSTTNTSQDLNNTSLDHLTSTSQDLNNTSQDHLTSTSQDLTNSSQDLTNSSQDLPSTSQGTTDTSQDLPSTSQDLSSTSQDIPSISQDLPSTSQDLPSTSQDLPGTSQDLTNSSQGTTNTSQDLSTNQNLPSTSQDLTNSSQGTTNTSQNLINSSQGTTNTSQDLTNTSQDLPSTSQGTTIISTCKEKELQTSNVTSNIKTSAPQRVTVAPNKPLSNFHKRGIPRCYNGSSYLLHDPPPLKTRRLVNNTPYMHPIRFQVDLPSTITHIPHLPLPGEMFCHLPSLPFNGSWHMPFSRPPLPFYPNGFPCRPPLLPVPSVTHYMCYGDARNRLL